MHTATHQLDLRHSPTRAGHDARHAAPRSRPRSFRSFRGMTLLDATVALAVIALVLTASVSVCDALVNDSADRQTHATLRRLNAALAQFYETHGTYPPAAEPALIDTAMARCIAALRSSPATESLVADLPGLTVTPAGWLTVRDGFGRVMIYVSPTPAPDSPADADNPDAPPAPAPAAPTPNPQPPTPTLPGLPGEAPHRYPRSPQNRPFIVSAGQDGQLGDLSSNDPAQRTASVDNLYSYAQEVEQ